MCSIQYDPTTESIDNLSQEMCSFETSSRWLILKDTKLAEKR